MHQSEAMKIFMKSVLLVAAIAGQLLNSSHIAQAAGLTLPPILDPIINPINNLTSPILDPLNNLTTPLLSPITNLTSPILDPLNNLTSAPIVGLNLTTVLGSLNLTAGTPALNLSTILGPLNLTAGTGLNLSNIIGPWNNLTGPLQTILSNFTGPASNLTVATNVTVTVTLNLPSTMLNLASVFPNGMTIVPLGMTEVSISLRSLQGTNLSTVPVQFMVPVISYLNFPVSGSAGVTLDIAPGTKLAITGLTTPITRLFFGVSWQTFPQLTNVLISKILPGSSQPVPLYNFAVPALM
uniref:Ts n=1 Tax=Apopellia endiviifolia (species B) TaxID=119729 RepID=F6KV81_9MARC|nr:Ts [Apopellia endiviifolia (species B)]AEG74034.1 Ts [Apopellia endiviifolia (species B)]